MATRIRAATRRDAPFLAWVMLAASRSHLPRGAWDVHVDGPEPRVLAFLERMAVQPIDSFCRWERFFVAEVDGRPAAALSGYAPRDLATVDPTPAMDAASRAILGWGKAELALAAARLTPFFTCVSEPPVDAWAIEWVATHPDYRRRGLIHELLLAATRAGRERGHSDSQILVLIGNTPAQCAYERAGYRVVDNKRHPDFARLIGCPGIARMTRAL